jgi:hypothetical protein
MLCFASFLVLESAGLKLRNDWICCKTLPVMCDSGLEQVLLSAVPAEQEQRGVGGHSQVHGTPVALLELAENPAAPETCYAGFREIVIVSLTNPGALLRKEGTSSTQPTKRCSLPRLLAASRAMAFCSRRRRRSTVSIDDKASFGKVVAPSVPHSQTLCNLSHPPMSGFLP